MLDAATVKAVADALQHEADVRAIEQGKTDLAAKQTELDTAKIELAKAEDVATKEIAEHLKTKQKLENVKAELEVAKKALANPAFASAAVNGSKTGIAEGGSEAANTLTQPEALAEYSKLTDPKARAEYRKNHAVELGLA